MAMVTNSMTVWEYIDSKIDSLNDHGRCVAAGNYGKVRSCQNRCCPKDDLMLGEITEDFINDFNGYLYRTGIQPVTVSFCTPSWPKSLTAWSKP